MPVRRVLAREDGVALAAVILVSMLLLGLTVVASVTGTRTVRTSTRDRNGESALAVAEAGVSHAMTRLQAGMTIAAGACTDIPQTATPQGTYTARVCRVPGGFTIESRGTTGGDQLGRSRTVRVTLGAPNTFTHALFSNTSIELKNNNKVYEGDVWANDSVFVDANTTIQKSVTSARSWVDLASGAKVVEKVWSGGTSGSWAIRVGQGAEIGGGAVASTSSPCPQSANPAFNVVLEGTNSKIAQGVTTLGSVTGNTNGVSPQPPATGTCTASAVPQQIPQFTFNPANYESHMEFTVSGFNAHLNTGNNRTNLSGVFLINDPNPSQTNRVDLSGVVLVGDTTIVSNAPVFTNGVSDTNDKQKVFVVASTHSPLDPSSCSVNHDSSDCAVHIKNNFDPSCRTAVLIYANRGPVAVKNSNNAGNSDDEWNLCGAVYADAILIKNNQKIKYDPRVSSVVGFGTVAYQARQWEERAQ